MTKRMLIDGAHPEESRVVIASTSRLEEYDVETSTKKQLKGNIYLAKVTRVEPSLQAAFVEFGGDRHGFLAFNDIHPDYFQIPVEDREALIAEESAQPEDEDAAQALVDDFDGAIDDHDDHDEEDEVEDPGPPGGNDPGDAESREPEPGEVDVAEQPEEDEAHAAPADEAAQSGDQPAPVAEWPGGDAIAEESLGAPRPEIVAAEPVALDPDGADATEEIAGGEAAREDAGEDPGEDPGEDGGKREGRRGGGSSRQRRGRGRNGAEAGADETEFRPQRRRARRYKIQEVIKRRQIILIQVVKEERGNKGAALTTYISLAGRYCVLMPNSARGGGISRKITSTTSRRKLKEIVGELDIPDGMGVIMRTVGMERNKSEIKRDFEYLIRAWDDVRERTMQATAPALVYEDANLIKRAIRDLYTKDIEEVLVDGAEAYQAAKKFMRLMMPSHAKRVQPYRDKSIPLFTRYQVEAQLDAMHSPEVRLKSGGYIVIHSTEALVAVDVNSGRSTRERNIEETALKTNIEAADEVALQLRLRDLAGLVVIDFIDMEESRHLRQVERRLKDALKPDRARIQIGRISGFGLLEMSRQRLRPSLQEASTQICRHCKGVGFIRSTESMALRVLRTLEEEGVRHRSSEISVAVPTTVALYVLNNKRATLADMEARYGFRVSMIGDDTVIPPDMRIERIRVLPGAASADPAAAVERAPEPSTEPAAEQAAAGEEDGERKRPRRRRSRRKPAGEAGVEAVAAEPSEPAAEGEPDQTPRAAEPGMTDETPAPKRRRRGRRGGRRRGGTGEEAGTIAAEAASEVPTVDDPALEEPATAEAATAEPETAEPETAELALEPMPASDRPPVSRA